VSPRRIIANLLVGIALAVILFGLVAIIMDERASHALDNVKLTYEEVFK
jgi:hypothetical protein